MRTFRKKRNSSQSQAIVSDIGSDGVEYPLQSSIDVIANESVVNYRKLKRRRKLIVFVFIPIGLIMAFFITVGSIVLIKEARGAYSNQLLNYNQKDVATSTCESPICYKASHLITDYLNKSVDPCDNYYEFVCGKRFEDRAENVDHFTMATDKFINDLIDLLGSPIDPSTTYKSVNNVKKLFQSCVDENKIESNSDKELLKYLSIDLGSWPMMSEKYTQDEFTIESYIANLTFLKSPMMFRFESDVYNNTKILMKIVAPADYCTLQSFIPAGKNPIRVRKFKKIFLQLRESLYEDETKKVEDDEFNRQFDDLLKLAQNIYFINNQIYSSKYKCYANKGPNWQLRLTISELNQEINANIKAQNLTEFNFFKYMEHLNSRTGVQMSHNTTVLITFRTLNYLKDLFFSLASTYNYNDRSFQRSLKNLGYFHTIYDLLYASYSDLYSVPLMPLRYYQIFYEYNKYIDPNFKLYSFYRKTYSVNRLKSCAYVVIDKIDTDGCLEQPDLQKFYLSNKFNVFKKDLINNMVDEIMKTSVDLIKQQSWIDEKTQVKVAERMQNIKFQIGFSDSYFSNEKNTEPKSITNKSEQLNSVYDALGENYVVNLLTLRKKSYIQLLEATKFDQTISERVRSQKYVFFIFLVNLVYLKAYNTIIVPAGVLTEPIVHVDLPMYLNYATIGAYISHEMWHMAHEELIESSSMFMYLNRTKCLSETYADYARIKYSFEIDEENAFDEQIADYFGIIVAFRTYARLSRKKNKLDSSLPDLSYTAEQLFFIRYSQSYCHKSSFLDENNFQLDHGVPEFRAFETVLTKEFNDAFKCQDKIQKYQIQNSNCVIFE